MSNPLDVLYAALKAERVDLAIHHSLPCLTPDRNYSDLIADVLRAADAIDDAAQTGKVPEKLTNRLSYALTTLKAALSTKPVE